MIDYYEILSFCAFDIDKAHEIVEGMQRERVEENEPKSMREVCGRLRCKGCSRCAGSDMARSVLIVVL
ncbi:MAG: hypothetical protein J6P40_04365 [Oscillospiraceae bacterium]|nr:hypothetical protein [Oscillospiraceae bacterium]